MLKTKLIYVGILICLLPLLFNQTFAQTEAVKQRRQSEHQAIKDLIRSKLLNAKISKQNLNPSLDKYSSRNSLGKTSGNDDRKSIFMNGNNVAVEIENYGGIAPGYGGIREITNLIWRDAPYIFQFCPLVGASVKDTTGKRIHIITDAMNDYDRAGLREIDP
ncbi:MAG: hypothetical protein Q8L04_13500, partial [Ignavibacteria bacterium]|nr:hypothetical protein [Ignavibacteria bacterium]